MAQLIKDKIDPMKINNFSRKALEKGADMSKLFETSKINGMRLSNRFVRSATWEGMAAEDGACTPELKDLYAQLAKGGVGLIITSHTYVRSEGKGTPRQLGIYKDELISGLRKFTQAIHRHDSRVAVEISHAGILTNEKLTGQTPLLVSQMDEFNQSPGKEMTVDTGWRNPLLQARRTACG